MSNQHETGSTQARELLPRTASLLQVLYQIQELRHATSPTSSSTHDDQLSALVARLSLEIERLAPVVEGCLDNKQTNESKDVDAHGRIDPEASVSASTGSPADIEQLRSEWTRVQERHAVLKEEMKEDGWLVRFRTTAEQAEVMVDTLVKSASELTRAVEQVEETASQPGPSNAGVGLLTKAQRSHASMRSTYTSSITKILKMMHRSLADRTTTNGEALRRHGDLVSRWSQVQTMLARLEARVQIALVQHDLAACALSPSAGEVEVLGDEEGDGGEYFEFVPKHKGKSAGMGNGVVLGLGTPGHRESGSSGASRSSSVGTPVGLGLDMGGSGGGGGDGGAQLNVPEINGRLRRRPSQTSMISNSTAKPDTRPRWNGSTKVDAPVTRTPNRRLSSYGAGTNGYHTVAMTPGRGGATSPSPSGLSTLTPSRIPQPTMRARQSFGGLGNSMHTPQKTATTTTASTLSHSSYIPPVPSIPANAYTRTPSRQSFATSRIPSSGSATLLNTPRSGRTSLGRAPPSAFRAGTPSGTPGIPPVPARPSSRMSMGGGGGGRATPAPPADPIPFEPSKYDLLDSAVAEIISENGFDAFVSRLDPSLKRGQRRQDGEEWKGTFIFGMGERGVSVKLVFLAGNGASARGGGGGGGGAVGGTPGKMTAQGQGKVMKCLARVAGQWIPLGDVLRERAERYGEVF